MLFTPSGTFYSKVQFKTEEEVEKVVVKNFKLLFGDYSILLPKSLIRTSGGKGSHPVVPSMAAAFVAGGARNGLTFWKNKGRKELKSLGK